MSYYSYLSNFEMVKRGVGDACGALKESSTGVFLNSEEACPLHSNSSAHSEEEL